MDKHHLYKLLAKVSLTEDKLCRHRLSVEAGSNKESLVNEAEDLKNLIIEIRCLLEDEVLDRLTAGRRPWIYR